MTSTQKILLKFIERAELYTNHLPTEKIDFEFHILDFQNNITQFLDHLYANYKSGENKGQYFPRPEYGENIENYKSRLDKASKRKYRYSSKSKEMQKLIIIYYEIICRHKYALSLLFPKAKHEKLHEVSPGYSVTGISAGWSNKNVKHLHDGSISLGGFIKIAGKTSNVRISNVKFNDDYVEDLRIDSVDNHNVVFNIAGKDIINIPFILWANRCILSCKEIYAKTYSINLS